MRSRIYVVDNARSYISYNDPGRVSAGKMRPMQMEGGHQQGRVDGRPAVFRSAINFTHTNTNTNINANIDTNLDTDRRSATRSKTPVKFHYESPSAGNTFNPKV